MVELETLGSDGFPDLERSRKTLALALLELEVLDLLTNLGESSDTVVLEETNDSFTCSNGTVVELETLRSVGF